ncbi:MAG TPA: class F sortase [Dehalococcoidia bacterium]|nr:class F sortase [Dehalococcoidia bacterium]
MRASIERLWERATPLQKGLFAGVPAVVIALGAIGAIYAGVSGSGDEKQVIAATPTSVPSTATPVPPSATPQPTATPTPEPVSAGLQDSGSYEYSSSDSTGGGGGGGGGVPLREGATQTGPGPITGTDMTLSIPSVGVNATIYSRTVGTNGQMGDPGGPWQVIWYDFAPSFIGVGGYPGEPGANVVLAGHVDYIGVGPAVFWSIRDLVPGTIVTVYSSTGTYNYSIQYNEWVDPNADFSQYVAQNGQESITLVTCIGSFSGGHYSNRIVVRGVRV